MGSDSMSVWVCIAGGESLTAADVRWCRSQGWDLATCNMGYKIVPDAHLFLAMDSLWWGTYADDLLATLSLDCQIWGVIDHPRVERLTWDGSQGLSTKRGHCHGGKLSGLSLIQAVGWCNPDLVVLLGYDNQGKHWHPDYPSPFLNSGVIDQTIGDYAKLASDSPFPILNCSRATAIDAFPRLLLEDVPQWLKRHKSCR